MLDLLRAFGNTHSLAEIGRDLVPQLAKLLPEPEALFPQTTSSHTLEPDEQKRRLFRGLMQFFEQLTRPAPPLAAQIPASTQNHLPLLIDIEDLHWSDDTSLEFLLQFGRRMKSQRILILATYRNDETHPAFEHFLAALDRERLAIDVVLRPLDRQETNRMVRAIVDRARPLNTELLENVHALTEGNPFFIEEICKAYLSAGDIADQERQRIGKITTQFQIPRSVRDAVVRRSATLSDTGQHTLSLAATVGRRFDFRLLEELTEMHEHDLLPIIKDLINGNLVVEESSDQFSFRHALTREAVYSSLLKRERKALHARIAETIERLHAERLETYLPDLAYHYHAAEVWERALEYAQRAGVQAHGMYAPRETIQQLTRALEAADNLSRVPSPALYRLRGQAFETVGEFESARCDYEQALTSGRLMREISAEWQALLDLGFLWASRDYARTGDYFQRALDLARRRGDSAMLAHTLNRVGNWRVNLDQPQDALINHREALDIFERQGDKRGIADTLDLLGMTMAVGADYSQAKSYWQKAVKLFREQDNRIGLISALANLAEQGINYNGDLQLGPAVQLTEAMAFAEEALGLAREIGLRSGECYALVE